MTPNIRKYYSHATNITPDITALAKLEPLLSPLLKILSGYITPDSQKYNPWYLVISGVIHEGPQIEHDLGPDHYQGLYLQISGVISGYITPSKKL